MSHSNSSLAGRIYNSMKHWFESRIQECVRCTGCDSAVFPFTPFCPKCGQGNPTQVSTSAAVCLVLGSTLLAIALSILTTNF
jgi:hypothetical protein